MSDYPAIDAARASLHGVVCEAAIVMLLAHLDSMLRSLTEVVNEERGDSPEAWRYLAEVNEAIALGELALRTAPWRDMSATVPRGWPPTE